jgi:hypothetical protein
MNSCQYSATFLIALFISIYIFLVKPWEFPRNNTQKWIRSLTTGFLIYASAFLFFAFFIIPGNNSICWVSFISQKLGILGCFLFPIIIMATLGTYISYGQLEWLLSVREKITISKKKETKK